MKQRTVGLAAVLWLCLPYVLTGCLDEVAAPAHDVPRPQAAMIPGTFSLGGIPGLLAEGRAVNSAGAVTGVVGSSVHPYPFVPFLWVSDVFTPLPAPVGASTSGAAGISESGLIAGTSVIDDILRATIWQDGIPALLFGPERFSTATGVGPAGHVVGTTWVAGNVGNTQATFVYYNGTITILPVPPEISRVHPVAANSSGHVLGDAHTSSNERRVILWRDGQVHVIASPDGSSVNSVGGLTDAGDVVFSSGVGRLYRWRDGLTELLPIPDSAVSFDLTDVAPGGAVLGHVEHPFGIDNYGVWANGHFYYLKLPTDARVEALAISDGYITGSYNFEEHAFRVRFEVPRAAGRSPCRRQCDRRNDR